MLEDLLSVHMRKLYCLMLELSEKKILSFSYIEQQYGWNKRAFCYHLKHIPLKDYDKHKVIQIKHNHLIYGAEEEIIPYILLIRMLKNNLRLQLLRLILEEKDYSNKELRHKLYISHSKFREEVMAVAFWLSNFHLAFSFNPYPKILGEKMTIEWLRFVFCYFDAVNEDPIPIDSFIVTSDEEKKRYLSRFDQLVVQKESKISRNAYFLFQQIIGREYFLISERNYAYLSLGVSEMKRNYPVNIPQKEAFLTIIGRIGFYYYWLATEDLCRFRTNTIYERACRYMLNECFPILGVVEGVNPELSKYFYHLLAQQIELPPELLYLAEIKEDE